MTIDKILIELVNRKERLDNLVKQTAKELDKYPKAKLIATKSKGYVKYYKRDESSRDLIYVKKTDTQALRELQHINHLTELNSNAKDEIECIDKAIKVLGLAKDPEKTFCELPFYKRNLIKPYTVPLAENSSFVKNNKFHASRPNSNLLTKAGERVRSKSELIIADKLYDAGVPYCYEMNTVAGPMQVYNPDFTVVNKVTGKLYYWEHFGMLDDGTYCTDCQLKMENLSKAGIYPGDNLIITFETSKRSLSTEYVDRLIAKYLL